MVIKCPGVSKVRMVERKLAGGGRQGGGFIKRTRSKTRPRKCPGTYYNSYHVLYDHHCREMHFKPFTYVISFNPHNDHVQLASRNSGSERLVTCQQSLSSTSGLHPLDFMVRTEHTKIQKFNSERETTEKVTSTTCPLQSERAESKRQHCWLA